MIIVSPLRSLKPLYPFCSYTFPVDDKAAICGFEAFIDGKKVVGKVQEKKEAQNTYDDAISEGHGAYLLEQQTDNVFTANIGNLPPGKGTNSFFRVAILTAFKSSIRGESSSPLHK